MKHSKISDYKIKRILQCFCLEPTAVQTGKQLGLNRNTVDNMLYFMNHNIKKNILIATGIFPPDIGGPASYVPKIAGELVKRNQQVTVLTYSDKHHNDSYQYKIVRVKRSKYRIYHYLKYFYQVIKLGRKNDVIFAQCPIASGLPVVMANMILRKRIIIKIVGDAAWEIAINKKMTHDNLDIFLTNSYQINYISFLKLIQSFVINKFDCVIVPSYYLSKAVSKYLTPKNIQKIKVIYNSFDILDFSIIDIISEKNKLGLRGKKIILSVARLVEWKNIDKLINIIPQLDNNIVLLVVGSGDQSNYQKMADQLNISDRIFFLGKIPKQKLYEIYQIADIFVLISTYEGMSHTLIEAMYMGLPVLVSNCGGNPETVDAYSKSIVVGNPNNYEQLRLAINKLLTIKKNAIADKFIIDKFSYSEMVSKTADILNK